MEAPTYSSRQAVLRMVEYQPLTNRWLPVNETLAVIGKNGMTREKKEGDMKTPIGLFQMGTGFGTRPAPSPSSWPYRLAGQNDYWVDDPLSPDYNQWVCYSGDPRSRWQSFEQLAIPPYTYAAVIRYNDSPVVPGKGSAIFFHIWSGPESYSAGCVTVAEEEVAKVLRWMAPEQIPLIAIGTPTELRQLVPYFK